MFFPNRNYDGKRKNDKKAIWEDALGIWSPFDKQDGAVVQTEASAPVAAEQSQRNVSLQRLVACSPQCFFLLLKGKIFGNFYCRAKSEKVLYSKNVHNFEKKYINVSTDLKGNFEGFEA